MTKIRWLLYAACRFRKGAFSLSLRHFTMIGLTGTHVHALCFLTIFSHPETKPWKGSYASALGTCPFSSSSTSRNIPVPAILRNKAISVPVATLHCRRIPCGDKTEYLRRNTGRGRALCLYHPSQSEQQHQNRTPPRRTPE